MRYKTLFRVMLKFLGVYFIVESVGTLVGSSIWFIESPGAAVPTQWWMYVSQAVPEAIKAVVGAYLFFGGKWIVDLAIPSNRPYCHECGYDLTGAAGNICNECGTPFRAPAPENAPRPAGQRR